MTRHPVHALIGGHPTSGKTTGACTWAKPLIVHLFDQYGKDGPFLKWAQINGGQIREDRVYLSGGVDTGIVRKYIETQTVGTIILDYFNDISPGSWSWYRYDQVITDRTSFMSILQPQQPGLMPGTLVIDSVTFMELSARNYWIYNISGAPSLKKDKTPDKWGPLNASTDALERMLLVELGGLPINYLVLAHFSEGKEDMSGVALHQISAPGRLEKKRILAAAFGEQYRAYVMREGTERFFLLQTQPDNRFQCATNINAPDPSWNDYESLWTNWDGGA